MLEGIKFFLHEWEQLVGSFMGASATIIVWWVAEKYQQVNRKKEEVLYLERVIVDQINMVLEAEKITNIFIDETLERLKKDVSNNPEGVYSINR